MELEIPKGYVLVPESWANKYFNNNSWTEINIPTISQVSDYVGVSIAKIRIDIKKIECPLRIVNEGSKGRGKEKKFLKSSVEAYKEWINKN